MEKIIKKAIEGGYRWWASQYPNLKETKEEITHFLLEDYEKPSGQDLVCDPLFWQALGKACGWSYVGESNGITVRVLVPTNHITGEEWKYHALKFHEINLTEGWDKAISYLQDLIK